MKGLAAREFFEASIARRIDHDRVESAKHGWQFKERDPDSHTIGDFVRAVLAVESPDDAKRFAAGYLQWLQVRPPEGAYTAEQLVKANIGWCFGEGMADERIIMWREACGAAHPVFGSMATRPTPQEALAVGKALGEGAQD